MGMRVLFLTCHLPFPPISGGRRREFELLRRIGDHADVTVCAVSKTYDEDLSNAAALEAYCSAVRVVPAEPGEPRDPLTPFQVLRHRSRHVRPPVIEGDYDVIHVEGFYLMQHLQHLPPRPTVLVEQNIEYQLWEQRAAHAHGPTAWRYRREADRTRRSEQTAWAQADIVATLTDEDRAVVRAAGIADVRLVPDGIDRHDATERADNVRPVITYVGNFAYQPNVDAAQYFVNDVLPEVIRRVPNAHLQLVGNAPPAEVLALAGPNVTVTGRVPDVAPFLRDAALVVCPLRVGGGVKVKMLEALSFGKAIVSTSVGTQGLGDVGDAVALADDAATMADAVARLLDHPDERQRLERSAALHAQTLPTWDDAADALLACYEQAAAQERLDA